MVLFIVLITRDVIETGIMAIVGFLIYTYQRHIIGKKEERIKQLQDVLTFHEKYLDKKIELARIEQKQELIEQFEELKLTYNPDYVHELGI